MSTIALLQQELDNQNITVDQQSTNGEITPRLVNGEESTVINTGSQERPSSRLPRGLQRSVSRSSSPVSRDQGAIDSGSSRQRSRSVVGGTSDRTSRPSESTGRSSLDRLTTQGTTRAAATSVTRTLSNVRGTDRQPPSPRRPTARNSVPRTSTVSELSSSIASRGTTRTIASSSTVVESSLPDNTRRETAIDKSTNELSLNRGDELILDNTVSEVGVFSSPLKGYSQPVSHDTIDQLVSTKSTSNGINSSDLSSIQSDDSMDSIVTVQEVTSRSSTALVAAGVSSLTTTLLGFETERGSDTDSFDVCQVNSTSEKETHREQLNSKTTNEQPLSHTSNSAEMTLSEDEEEIPNVISRTTTTSSIQSSTRRMKENGDRIYSPTDDIGRTRVPRRESMSKERMTDISSSVLDRSTVDSVSERSRRADHTSHIIKSSDEYRANEHTRQTSPITTSSTTVNTIQQLPVRRREVTYPNSSVNDRSFTSRVIGSDDNNISPDNLSATVDDSPQSLSSGTNERTRDSRISSSVRSHLRTRSIVADQVATSHSTTTDIRPTEPTHTSTITYKQCDDEGKTSTESSSHRSQAQVRPSSHSDRSSSRTNDNYYSQDGQYNDRPYRSGRSTKESYQEVPSGRSTKESYQEVPSGSNNGYSSYNNSSRGTTNTSSPSRSGIQRSSTIELATYTSSRSTSNDTSRDGISNRVTSNVPDYDYPSSQSSSRSVSEEDDDIPYYQQRSQRGDMMSNRNTRPSMRPMKYSNKTRVTISEHTLELEKERIEKHQIHVLSSNILTYDTIQYTIHKCIDTHNIVLYVVGPSISAVLQDRREVQSMIPDNVCMRACKCISHIDGLLGQYRGQVSLLLLSPSLGPFIEVVIGGLPGDHPSTSIDSTISHMLQPRWFPLVKLELLSRRKGKHILSTYSQLHNMLIEWQLQHLRMLRRQLQLAVNTTEFVIGDVERSTKINNTTITDTLSMYDKTGECRTSMTAIKGSVESIERTINMLTVMGCCSNSIADLGTIKSIQ